MDHLKKFNFEKTAQVISRNKTIFFCSFWLLLFLWRWLKCMALIEKTLYDLRLRYFVRLLQCNIRYWFRNTVSASWWKTLSNIIYILFYNLESKHSWEMLTPCAKMYANMKYVDWPAKCNTLKMWFVFVFSCTNSTRMYQDIRSFCHSHIYAQSDSYFVPDTTKSNQKTLINHLNDWMMKWKYYGYGTGIYDKKYGRIYKLTTKSYRERFF